MPSGGVPSGAAAAVVSMVWSVVSAVTSAEAVFVSFAELPQPRASPVRRHRANPRQISFVCLRFMVFLSLPVSLPLSYALNLKTI